MATRRLFSTSARLRNLRASVDVAAPLKSQTTAQIETTELKALREKAKGPWKNLTNEEKITLYRASFPQSFAEIKAPTGEWKKVLAGTLIGVATGVGLFAFLKSTVGPTPPHTLTEEWQKASEEKLRRQLANPISGVSSKS
ncbi:cytochrome c oxidase subunit 4 isoform 2, mitochondrial-like [Corticium candelabrum]|uniref:cytochrome c oxidase subunit 4 isoform 2, mitochondrial-like n=1 Tax=Corticium candelabrum TaxID=121492 RepID=UPI002E26FC6B|nr:cytochrome c oxidase subunit 4 isoform 2, mitochondrial-like [Corticium candelabrum]